MKISDGFEINVNNNLHALVKEINLDRLLWNLSEYNINMIEKDSEKIITYEVQNEIVKSRIPLYVGTSEEITIIGYVLRNKNLSIIVEEYADTIHTRDADISSIPGPIHYKDVSYPVSGIRVRIELNGEDSTLVKNVIRIIKEEYDNGESELARKMNEILNKRNKGMIRK